MALKGRFSVYVHSVAGTGGITAYRLRWATASDDNFGTTVDATEADFFSTDASLIGDSATITGTGWVSWEFDIPAGMPLGTGTIYWRISDVYENYQDTSSTFIRSADYAGTDYDPKFEVWEEMDTPITRTMMGIGL